MVTYLLTYCKLYFVIVLDDKRSIGFTQTSNGDLNNFKDASRKIKAGELKEEDLNKRVSYNDVQEEIAEKRGFSMKGAKTPGDLILQEDLLKIMPIGKI